MSYKLAIFDLDGTVLDTLDDLADSVNHALAVHNLPERSIDEIRTFIGNGARLLIERSVPEGCGKAVTDLVFTEFQTYYKTHGDIKTKPYDGVIDMLAKLRARGVRLAVLSNKPNFAVQILCERYFGGVFDSAAGEKAGVPRKPAPDALYTILADYSVSVSDAVYIGDSEVDIETAKNANMDCISVTWGFRDGDFLAASGATRSVSTVSGLFDAIIK